MTGFFIVMAILVVVVVIAVVGNDIRDTLGSISSHLDRIAWRAEHPNDFILGRVKESPDVIDGKERKRDAIHHSGGLAG